MGEKRGLKNIGWGMMVKRKFEREKVVIVNGKKIGGWIVRGGIAAVGCSSMGRTAWEEKTAVAIYCGNQV